MFSEPSRTRLNLDKHTRWATNLCDPDLDVLLCLVGEFGGGAKVLKFLDSHREEINSGLLMPARVALERIAAMTWGPDGQGERIDVGEAQRRIFQVGGCAHG
jgi:hypothetical protein